MILVVFDIDGTLADTNLVDLDCYLNALEKVFNISTDASDWEAFSDMTDSGILRDIFLSRFNRLPSDEERTRFIETFVGSLETAYSKAPDRFKEILGAGALLDELSKSPDYAVAMATGGWGASAAFKLKCAGMDINEYPFASANDGHTRADIVNTAIQRAEERRNETGFSRVVLVGDGSWDIRTARELEKPFIGLGDDVFFRSEGVIHSVPDYMDRDGFITLLGTASIPGPAEGKSKRKTFG
jgi:phosphoglycolate phosphatase-like HAD superfamily hydrolase